MPKQRRFPLNFERTSPFFRGQMPVPLHARAHCLLQTGVCYCPAAVHGILPSGQPWQGGKSLTSSQRGDSFALLRLAIRSAAPLLYQSLFVGSSVSAHWSWLGRPSLWSSPASSDATGYPPRPGLPFSQASSHHGQLVGHYQAVLGRVPSGSCHVLGGLLHRFFRLPTGGRVHSKCLFRPASPSHAGRLSVGLAPGPDHNSPAD